MILSEIHIRDPFVLVEDGKYYMYGTRGSTCWGPATGFDVYVSDNLEDWSDPVAIFENDGSFWSDINYWAPEVHKYKDKFYLFASFKSETNSSSAASLIFAIITASLNADTKLSSLYVLPLR